MMTSISIDGAERDTLLPIVLATSCVAGLGGKTDLLLGEECLLETDIARCRVIRAYQEARGYSSEFLNLEKQLFLRACHAVQMR